MRDFIIDALNEINRVADDIAEAPCISGPVEELLIRYLEGRRDALESVLNFIDRSDDSESDEVTKDTEAESDSPAEEAKEPSPESGKDKPLTREDPRITEIMNLADELSLKLKTIEPLVRGRRSRKIISDWIQANDEYRCETILTAVLALPAF